MDKHLIYDGDCPFCIWISERFEGLGIVGSKHRRSFQSCDGELATRLEEAGIRNEMLVLDQESGELRSGIEGFLWLLRDSRLAAFAGFLRFAPVRALLRLGYRTIAYNRRFLAPPRRGIVCACDPDPHAGFNALFWLVVVAFNLTVAALFGYATSSAWLPVRFVPAALLVVLAWPAVALGARVSSSLPNRALLSQSAMVVSFAALVAAPFLVLSLLAAGAVAKGLVVVGVSAAAWRLVVGARRRLVG